MHGPVKSYRFAADVNLALPAGSVIHKISLVNGTLSAIATIRLYDNAKALKLTATQTNTSFDNVAPNGTFAAGSGYGAGDTITLSDSSLITVDTVTAGAVATFTVTTAGTGAAGPITGTALTQSSTSGSGTGFTLTPGEANVLGAVDPVAELKCNDDGGATWQDVTSLNFKPPLFLEVGASLSLIGTSAVGYLHYTR
jgi:hypothetical protein